MPVEGYTEAQVALQARGRLERPLLAMVYLGIVAFCLATGSIFYLFCATLTVGLNLMVIQKQKEVYLHKTIITAAVILATLQLIAEVALEASRGGTLISLQRYLVVIQLCKLFQQKGNRDYVHLLATSLLLVVSVSLVCEQPWFLPLLAAYLLLAAYSAMAFTLKRGLDAAVARQLVTEPAPLSPQRVAWNAIHRWPRRALIGRTVAAVAFVSAFGVMVFLFVPRSSRPGPFPIGSSAQTGPSDTVSLDSPDRLKLSNEVLMRVRRAGGGPPPGQLYLRGRTFTVYRQSTWRPGAHDAGPGRLELDPPPAVGIPADAQALNIAMAGSMVPRLFAPHPTVQIIPDRGQARGTPGGEWVVATGPETGDRQFRYTAYHLPEPLRPEQLARLVRPLSREEILDRIARHPRPLELLAQASLPREKEALAKVLSPAEVRLLVAGELWPWQRPAPDGMVQLTMPQRRDAATVLADPRYSVTVPPSVEALAQEWCADLLPPPAGAGGPRGDPLAVARRIRQRLQETCRYATDFPGADRERDGVEDFLLHTRRGHCEYFASAMTVMCRSLSVPARLATGFCVTADEMTDPDFLVRARHAHAWTEVYTGQTGWVVVDATPGGGQAGSGGRRSWWQRFSDAWQTWRFRWQDGVFGYDAAAQQRLQAWIADRWDDVRVVAKEAWAAVGRGMIELVARGHVTAAILWLAAAVAGLSVVIEILIVARAVRRRIVTARQVRRQLGLRIRDLRFMIRLYRLLRRHRLQPVPGETLRELAARAAGVLGCPAEAVTSLVDLYYRLRWGPPGQAAEGLPAQIAAAERFVERLYRPARDAVA